MNRRITTVLLVTTTFFIHKAYSRNIPENERSFGVHGGYILSNVAFVPKVPQSFTTGWRGGFSFRQITEKHLGVVAELSLSQQGWTEKPLSAYNRSLTYLELPFLTHITFGDRFRFYLNLGPKIAFLLREKGNRLDASLAELPPQQILPVANRFDWGLCGGPGIELCLSFVRILVETRYYYALGNLFSSRKEDVFPQSSLRTLSFNLIFMASPTR
ncbi:MAG: PorT family protein [Tannerellaceae bacterium]|jgi:hypothetical protein|nr:PorT family protein [Tannerellaceae bacterium]